MDNIYKYRLFLKTVETGNITRTAEQFFVSQSAVSQQLKQLEEYFGKPLFYKDKTLKLTPFGRAIEEDIRQLITYYTHKENHIRQISEDEASMVSIVGKTAFIVDVLEQFFKRGDVPVQSLKNRNTHDICRELVEGKAHIGFGEPEKGYDELEAVEILQIPIVMIAAPNAQVSETISVKELHDETLILYEDSTFVGRKIQDLLIQHQVYPKNVIRSNHSKIIRMLVSKGYGYGFVYLHTLRRAEPGTFKKVFISDGEIRKPYYMMYNKKFLSATQMEVVNRLKDFFKKEGERVLENYARFQG